MRSKFIDDLFKLEICKKKMSINIIILFMAELSCGITEDEYHF